MEDDFNDVGSGSKNNVADHEHDAAINKVEPRLNFSRIAQLVADDEIPWPTNLSPNDADRLRLAVREIRRSQLVYLVARLIAADIARSTGVEAVK